MKTQFGLDFGTTNSALSVNRGGLVEPIKINPYGPGGTTLRSVIYFSEEKETFVGESAIINYLEDGATGRFLQSIKSYLPDESFDGTVIWGKKRSLEELIAVILRDIKTIGEKVSGQEIEKILLGRPVFFSDDATIDKMAEGRLAKAAKLAGFKEINFQLEPIAAGLSYERSLPDKKERKVLLGDFGGGTSDFTVMR